VIARSVRSVRFLDSRYARQRRRELLTDYQIGSIRRTEYPIRHHL